MPRAVFWTELDSAFVPRMLKNSRLRRDCTSLIGINTTLVALCWPPNDESLGDVFFSLAKESQNDSIERFSAEYGIEPANQGRFVIALRR